MASDVIKGLVCKFAISPRRIVPRNLIGDNVFRGKARKRTINDVIQAVLKRDQVRILWFSVVPDQQIKIINDFRPLCTV